MENIENVQVENQTVETQVVETEKPARRVSNHINHENCVELRRLIAALEVETGKRVNEIQIVRGTKNAKFVPLVTEKENELLQTFIETDYNIKRTGELLNFSHTNVWQRLYGNNKTENRAIGILGKLKKYEAGEYAKELPVVEVKEPAAEQPAEPAQDAEIA